MSAPVSVVVVSRNRPTWLQRCLRALDQLDYDPFEVVVVACAKGIAAAKNATTRRPVTLVPFDKANISDARNVGVRNSLGQILAFIDDDAVPEPTWLAHLIPVFDAPNVDQAGGTTLGRNGISVQHAAARVTPFGKTVAVAVPTGDPIEICVQDECWPRLHGTNMAVRRSALVHVGGFDPSYAFYLDETDLTCRVAKAGGATVYVPNAVVHHTSAESAVRNHDRVPRDLHAIGYSTALFHSEHAAPTLHKAARTEFLHERRQWLLRHVQQGTLTPDDLYIKMRALRRGYSHGMQAPKSGRQVLDQVRVGDIKPTDKTLAKDVYLTSSTLIRGRVFEKAKTLVHQGHRVTVLDFDPSARFHKVTFVDDGYWLHTGGIWGREERDERLFQRCLRNHRVRSALTRIKGVRSLTPMMPAN